MHNNILHNLKCIIINKPFISSRHPTFFYQNSVLTTHSRCHFTNTNLMQEQFCSFFQKAQEEIEGHLRTAEVLSLKGDTRGQKDQIVNELLKVHTRFQARITEYQVLINMTIKFFKNLDQVLI